MIIVTRITPAGNTYPLAFNARNFIEATPQQDSPNSWVKYWDGEKVRSVVVTEPVILLVTQANKS